MPQITLKLFASLQKYLPVGSSRRQTPVAVEEGTTVGTVLERLGMPRSAAHLIMVNGQQREWDAPLAEGDVVSVFPPVAGGAGKSDRFPTGLPLRQ